MCRKKYLALFSRRLFLMFRSMGWAFFVPLLVLNVLLPLAFWREYRKIGLDDEFRRHIQQTTSIFVPLFSGWWISFFLRNVIESNGGEAIYLGHQKRMLRDLLLIFSVYFLNVSLQYLVYILAFPELGMDYLKIIFPCIFIFSFVFFLGSRTKSIVFAMIMVFFYVLMDYLLASAHAVFPLYSSMPGADFPHQFLVQYLPLTASSCVLLGVGLKRKSKL